MTERAVPFNLGRGTCLRFDRGDIEALETAFSTITGRRIGYPDFPEFLHTLTGTGLFIWRGLKTEAPDGKLIHVFPLTVEGSEEAGEAVFAFLQGDKAGTLNPAISDALVATGLWKVKTAEEKKGAAGAKGAPAPKNSKT